MHAHMGLLMLELVIHLMRREIEVDTSLDEPKMVIIFVSGLFQRPFGTYLPELQ